MTSFFDRLKERKLVQWALAYLAGAWVLLQVFGELRDTFAWPPVIVQVITVVLGVGFFAALVLAWYHGEKGQQRVSGPELLMLSALLVLAGVAVVIVGGNSAPTMPHASQSSTAGSAAMPLPTTPAEHASIAVLPFTDMSPGKDQEYFSDGITEEILNALAQIPGLKVAARTSAFQFKGMNPDIREVGQKLGVAHVLEGSVQRSGERLRISAQLIDARTGYHLWGDKYDRELRDLFAIEDEISRTIASQLRVRLAGGTAQPIVRAPTTDLEAHDLLLRAGFFFNKHTERDLRRSIELYEAALARDSTLAPAWAGISAAWAWLADDWLPPREAYPKAKAAALKAIAADSTFAGGHGTFGIVLLLHDWDFAAAERVIRHAFTLGSTGGSYYDLGDLFSATGRLDSAIVVMRRAQLADPLAPQGSTRLGDFLSWAGRYDEAVAEYREALELQPDYGRALIGIGSTLLLRGRPEDALQVLRQAPETGVQLQEALARTYAALGQRTEAQRVARELEQESRQRYVSADRIASIYAALGERESAFRWLDRAYRERSAGLVWLGSDRRWDPIRSDPQFQRILRSIQRQ
ncbi:MAG: tetratricopeptide repeat protein [Gemmatimonadetes bacterium]|nr:tetratricopeptide repeat protein [Gemmatimonadota bacterium]